jgi:putative solute:sodium symporter small subunit
MTVDDRSQSAQRRYWRRNLRLIGVLLLIWSVVSFVLVWYARELSFDFFGWPFSFYMAAQGSLLVYLVLVGVYARWMNRLDRDIEVHQDAP